MEPVSTITSRACPIDANDVDTAQSIPKQYLTRVERTVDTVRIAVPWGAGSQTAAFHPADPVVIAERSH